MIYTRLLSAFALTVGLLTTGIVEANAAIEPNTPSPSLTAISADGTIWNYATTGNGKVGSRTQVGTGWNNTKQVLSVDWNNDKITDIITRMKDGKLLLHTGTGSNSYRLPVTLGSGWENFDIVVTKLRRSDQYPGIIARNVVDGKLHYYPNTFGGTPSTPLTIGGGWAGLTELSALDFDQDGGMDLLARNTNGNLYLYRTDGLGNFVGETRKSVGNGWNPMTSISVKTDFAGPGTMGLVARNSQGQLYYYPVTTGKINAGKLIGSGWNSYIIAEGASSAALNATPSGVYETAYSKLVYGYVKNWCPSANVVLNHYSVNSGDTYGMTWWRSNNLAIRTDIPASITKSIALHECAHLLQAKAYGYNGYNAAVTRMNAIYGVAGRGGIESSADCIAAYLSPYVQPASLGATAASSTWSVRCGGYKGTAAKLIIQGQKP